MPEDYRDVMHDVQAQQADDDVTGESWPERWPMASSQSVKPDPELQAAQERADAGWDRDQARQVLADSVKTIRAASNIARIAVEAMETVSTGLQADLTFLKDLIERLQDQGEINSPRKSGLMNKIQARQIITGINKLLKSMDVGVVVKLSLDLTNQARGFVEMMERIDRRYGAEDLKKEQDITEHLTAPQLMQVMAWLEQNKQEGEAV